MMGVQATEFLPAVQDLSSERAHCRRQLGPSTIPAVCTHLAGTRSPPTSRWLKRKKGRVGLCVRSGEPSGAIGAEHLISRARAGILLALGKAPSPLGEHLPALLGAASPNLRRAMKNSNFWLTISYSGKGRPQHGRGKAFVEGTQNRRPSVRFHPWPRVGLT